MDSQFRPGMSVEGRKRYTNRRFPPYSYVPGVHPHPESDPLGHSFGQTHPPPAALLPDQWNSNETYLFAIDLFNHGYYWEAHEAWESLWHVAGRQGPVADWLKGLIKLAAAAIKLREGNSNGVRRHAQRARQLITSVCQKDGRFAGLDAQEILEFLVDFELLEPQRPANSTQLVEFALHTKS